MTSIYPNYYQPVRFAGCGSGGGAVYNPSRIGGGGMAGAQQERSTVHHSNRDFDLRRFMPGRNQSLASQALVAQP